MAVADRQGDDMPTNRRRIARKSNYIPQAFSPKYIAHLKVMDFGGWLTPEEIPVAKKLGIYKWDKWTKDQRKQREERWLQIENAK